MIILLKQIFTGEKRRKWNRKERTRRPMRSIKRDIGRGPREDTGARVKRQGDLQIIVYRYASWSGNAGVNRAI